MSRIMTRSRSRRFRLFNENEAEDEATEPSEPTEHRSHDEVDFNNNDINNNDNLGAFPESGSNEQESSPNPNVGQNQNHFERQTVEKNSKCLQQSMHWTFSSVSNKLLLPFSSKVLSNWLSRIKWKRKSRHIPSVLTLIVVFILLALMFFCTNVSSVCVWQGGGGFRLACGFKQSGLFRLRSLGGLKGWAGAGFTIGDEDGFKDSMTNTDPTQSQQRTGVAAAGGESLPPSGAKQRIGRFAGDIPGSLGATQSQAGRYLQQPMQFQQQFYPPSFPNRGPGTSTSTNKKPRLWESWKWPSLSKKKGQPAPQGPLLQQRLPFQMNYPPALMNYGQQQPLAFPQRPPSIIPGQNQMMGQFPQTPMLNTVQRQGLPFPKGSLPNFPSFSPMPEFPAFQDDNVAVESATNPLTSPESASARNSTISTDKRKKPYGLELLEHSDNFGKKFKIQSSLPEELENTLSGPTAASNTAAETTTNLGYDTNLFPDIYFTTTLKTADKLNKILRVDARNRVHRKPVDEDAAPEIDAGEDHTTESLVKKLKLKKIKLVKNGKGGYTYRKKAHRTTASTAPADTLIKTTTEADEQEPEEDEVVTSTTFRTTTARKPKSSTTFRTTTPEELDEDDEDKEYVPEESATEPFRDSSKSRSTTIRSNIRKTTAKPKGTRRTTTEKTTTERDQYDEETKDDEDQEEDEQQQRRDPKSHGRKLGSSTSTVRYPPPRPRIPSPPLRNTEPPLRPDYGDEFEYQMPTKGPVRRVTHYGHSNLLKDKAPNPGPTIMTQLRRERPNLSASGPARFPDYHHEEPYHREEPDPWNTRDFHSSSTTESPFDFNMNLARGEKPYDPRYPPDHEINHGAIPPASVFNPFSTPAPPPKTSSTEHPFYMKNSYFNPNSHYSKEKEELFLSSSLRTTMTTAVSDDVGPFVKFDSGESVQLVNRTRDYNSQFYSHFNKSAAGSRLTGPGNTYRYGGGGGTGSDGQHSFSSRSGMGGPSTTMDYYSYFASSTTPKPHYMTEYPENPADIVWPWERPHSKSIGNRDQQQQRSGEFVSASTPRSILETLSSSSSEHNPRWSSHSIESKYGSAGNGHYSGRPHHHQNHRYHEDSSETQHERQKVLNLLKKLPYWREPFISESTTSSKVNRLGMGLGLGPEAAADFITDDNFKSLPAYFQEPERTLLFGRSSTTTPTPTEAPYHSYSSTPSYEEWKGYVESVGHASKNVFTTPKPRPPTPSPSPITSRRRMFGSSTTTATPTVINRGDPVDPYRSLDLYDTQSSHLHSRYGRPFTATPTPPAVPFSTDKPDYGSHYHYGNGPGEHAGSNSNRRMLMTTPAPIFPGTDFENHGDDMHSQQKRKNFKIIVIDNIENEKEKEALVHHFSTTARPIHASPSTMIFDSRHRSSTTASPPVQFHSSTPNSLDEHEPRDTSMDPIENLQDQIKKLSEQSNSVLHKYYTGDNEQQQRREDFATSSISPGLDEHKIRLQQFESLKKQFEQRQKEEAQRFAMMVAIASSTTTALPPTVSTAFPYLSSSIRSVATMTPSTMRPYLQNELSTMRNVYDGHQYFPDHHHEIQAATDTDFDHYNVAHPNIGLDTFQSPTTIRTRDRDTAKRIISKNRYKEQSLDEFGSTTKSPKMKRIRIKPVTITSHDVEKPTMSAIPAAVPATNLVPPGLGKRKPFIPNQTLGPPPPLPDGATFHLNDFDNPMQQNLNNQLETDWELYSISGVRPLQNSIPTAAAQPSPSSAYSPSASPSLSAYPSRSPSLKQRLKEYHLNKKANSREDQDVEENEEEQEHQEIPHPKAIPESETIRKPPLIKNVPNIMLPSSHYSITPSSTTAIPKHHAVSPVRHMLPGTQQSTPIPSFSSRQPGSYPTSTLKYVEHSPTGSITRLDHHGGTMPSSRPHPSTRHYYEYEGHSHGISSPSGPTVPSLMFESVSPSFGTERHRTMPSSAPPTTTSTGTTPSTTTTVTTTTTTTEKPKTEQELILEALETLNQAKSDIVETIVKEKFGGKLPNEVIKIVPKTSTTERTTTTTVRKRLNSPSPTPNLFSFSVANKIASLLDLNPPTSQVSPVAPSMPSLALFPSSIKNKTQPKVTSPNSTYEIMHLGSDDLAAITGGSDKSKNNVEVIEFDLPDNTRDGELPHASPSLQTMITAAIERLNKGEKINPSMISITPSPTGLSTRQTLGTTTTTKKPIIMDHPPGPSPIPTWMNPNPSPTSRSAAQEEIAQKLTQMGIIHKLSTNNLTSNQIDTLRKLLKLNQVEQKLHQMSPIPTTTTKPEIVASNPHYDIIKVGSNMDLNKIFGNLLQQQNTKKQLQAVTSGLGANNFNNRILPVSPSMMSFVGNLNQPQPYRPNHHQQQQQILPNQYSHRIIHSGPVQNLALQHQNPSPLPLNQLLQQFHPKSHQQQQHHQMLPQPFPITTSSQVAPTLMSPNFQQMINQHHKQQQLQILNNPTLKALQALAFNRAQNVNPSPQIQFPQQVAPGGEPIFQDTETAASENLPSIPGTPGAVDYVDLSPLFGGGNGGLLKRNAPLPMGFHRITNIRKAPKSYHPSTETGIIGTKDNSSSELAFDPIPAEIYTTFQCEDQKYFPGLYADPVNSCEVFHLCAKTETGILMKTFACPKATVFDQEVLRCNWNLYVDCSSAQNKYHFNKYLSQSFQFLKTLGEFSSSYPKPN